MSKFYRYRNLPVTENRGDGKMAEELSLLERYFGGCVSFRRAINVAGNN